MYTLPNVKEKADPEKSGYKHRRNSKDKVSSKKEEKVPSPGRREAIIDIGMLSLLHRDQDKE